MSTTKLIALAILALGIVLVIYGVSASESFSSDVSAFSPVCRPTRRFGC
jgi:hypothetical protein